MGAFMQFGRILFLLLSLLAWSLKAHDRHAGFLIDYHLSPGASATTFIGINRALAAAEDLALEKNPLNISEPWKIVVRSGALALVWLPVNYFSMLIQHEFFGHGVKYYEFGAKPYLAFKEVPFNFPPPYGKGVISPGPYDIPENFTKAKDYLTTVAGIVAGDVFSDRLSLDWAQSDAIEGRLAFLYILNAQQTLGYTYLRKVIDFGRGNDILTIQKTLNAFLKGDQQDAPDALSDTYLNWAVFPNALDPISYWSFYALFEYARSGQDVAFPWIHFHENFSYLPVPRGVITPFGPAFYLNNYMKLFKRTFRLYAHVGSLASNSYGGVGLEGTVWRWPFLSLGGRAEIFSEPSLNLDANFHFADKEFKQLIKADKLFGHNRIGALGLLCASYHFAGPYSLNIEAGYKSRGYVPGERIANTFILRAGASVSF